MLKIYVLSIKKKNIHTHANPIFSIKWGVLGKARYIGLLKLYMLNNNVFSFVLRETVQHQEIMNNRK